MRKFYSLNKCNPVLNAFQRNRLFPFKIALIICSFFMSNKALADYTVAAGATVDASTITGQSGILTINGTLNITRDVSLPNFTAVIINAPGGQIYWTKNYYLTFSANVSFDILNNAPGLQPTAGNGNAATGLYIGSTLIAVQSDNSNKAAFSFESFNGAGGLPRFNLTISAAQACYGSPITATLIPTDNSTNFDCNWSIDNSGSISPNKATNVKTSQIATISPVNSSIPKTYNITCSVIRGGLNISTKTVSVTVNPVFLPGTVSGTASVCAGSNSSLLTVSGSTGTIQWQSSADNNTFQNISGATSTSYTATNLSSSTYYRVTTTGTCSGANSNAVKITVNSKPTLSGVTQAPPPCAGPITINLSGLVPGSVNTINYAIGGVAQTPVNITSNAAGNGSFNTPALTTADNAKILLITSINNNTGCSLSPASFNVTLNIKGSGTWLGITSNWNDPQNWCSGIPASTTDVTIASGVANYPVIASGITAMVRNIQVDNGASLTISNNGTMKIAGVITNNGLFDAKNGSLEFNGTTAQSVSGSEFEKRTVNSLKISNTVALNLSSVLNDTLNITGAVSFGVSNTTFNTNDNLTLKSTAVSYCKHCRHHRWRNLFRKQDRGKSVVERYLNTGTGTGLHGKKWLFVSTPTTGQSFKESWMENGSITSTGYGIQITGEGGVDAGFDVKSPSPSVKYFDASTQNWVGIKNTSLPVYDARGYQVFVRGDRSVNGSTVTAPNTVTLRTKGNILSGDQVVNLPATNQFVSVGNPYAAAIDMRKVASTNGSDFFYVWNASLGGTYGYGAYETYFKNGDGNFYSIPGFVQNNVIESGQAFLVQTTKIAGSLTFKENSKVAASNNQVFRPAGVSGRTAGLRTSLYSVSADGAALIDGTFQQFADEYSSNVDELDARKVFNSGENISVRTAGKDLIVERKATINKEDTIFFNLTSVKVQNYRLQFDASDLSGTNIEGFIEDAFLKTRTPLNLEGTTILDFAVTNVAASYAASRFSIVFKTAATVLPVTFTSVKAYQKEVNISVEWKVENESNMKQYEIEKSLDGNQFSKVAAVAAINGSANNYSWLDKKASAGYNYYRIRSVDINGKISYTQVVKVFMGKASGEISIFPNPIVNGVVNLQLVNQPAGIYGVRLLNPLGQVMLTRQVTHTEGSSTETIKWDNNYAHGIYQLEVSQPSGDVKTIKVAY